MLKNYFHVALRNLFKNKVFSFINITGLGIGLACVILIFSYVRLELSYDKFHPDHQNIYRITTQERKHSAYNYLPLAPLLKQNMSGLKQAVRVFPHSGLVSVNKKDKFREPHFCFADSAFFEVFKFTAIDGSLTDALYKPMSVVITKSKAEQYFGTIQATGKELFFEDDGGVESYNVVAVIEDMPENSHFDIPFIASMVSLNTVWPTVFNPDKAWFWPPIYLYTQMTDGSTTENIQEQLGLIANHHLPEDTKDKTFKAQKLTDIHLNSNLLNEWQANSSYTYIRIFTTIAFFILLLACINYMNLATSKSLQRAGEVGIRKAMGSYRSQLVYMFFGESLLTVGLAIFIGLALAQISMVLFFNSLLQKTLSVDFLINGINLIYLIGGWVGVSALAGIYPALYISSFNTIKALKGKGEGIGSALGLRKGLVVFQFFISALLLVGTFAVIQQTHYVQNKDLGYIREQIINISLEDNEDRVNYLNFKNKLLDESFVINASVSAALPLGEGFYDWEIMPESYPDEKGLVVRTISTDEDFLKTFGIQLVDGRDFSKDIISDQEQGFIINQELAKLLDWSEPVGKNFQLTFYTNDAIVRKGKVIGVVEDFNFQSLYSKIEPLVIFINTHRYYADFLSVRMENGNLIDQINKLKENWNEFSPNRPFEFSFLDERVGKLYAREVTTSKLLSIFTGLSIIISCLGLFGLASFTVQQRTKEIGVRKVLGASALSIVQLLSREFVVLVIVANVLAWPLAWYGVNQWLSQFAYHVEIEPIVFALTILLILTITILAVGFQSVRAALLNPVDSLRNE